MKRGGKTMTQTTKLIHTTGKHNKFWRADITPRGASVHVVTCKWGRLGTTGQNKEFEFHSQYQAERFVHQKFREKQRKGYEEVDDKTYDLHVFRGALVGAGAKIDQLCWVKKKYCAVSSQTNYEEMTDIAAMADPSYEPTIYAKIRFTGKRGEYSLIITLDSILHSSQCDYTYLSGSTRRFSLIEPQEITDESPKILRNLKEKADGMVQSLL
jgi:predicted DNA-binding WGR domain protein